MSKVLVAFGSDGTSGDSCFQPDSCGKAEDGTTFEEATTMFMTNIRKDWEIPADWTDEMFTEEYGLEPPVGFWIIEDKLLGIITNINADWGNDSAVYAGIRTMKCQIESGSDRILTK